MRATAWALERLVSRCTAALVCGCLATCASPSATSQPVVVDSLQTTGQGSDASAATAQTTGDASPTSPDSGAQPTEVQAGGPADAPGLPDAALDAAPAKTTIWIHHPKPSTLQLRGSATPLTWSVDFAPQALTATAARFDVPAASGPFQVKPVASGAWSLGANFVVQLNQSRDIYPYFDSKLSAPRRDDFSLPGPNGAPRMVRVRLPAGYDENTVAKYPLLLMFDGQNVFDAQTATFGVAWELDEAIDLAMAEAKFQETVVVAVDHGGAKRIHEYTPWPDPEYAGGGGKDHLAWIHDQVLPSLANKYRLQAGPQSHCIGGSSLGALMALYAVGAHPEQWRCAIAMSGAWWWSDLKIVPWLATAPGVAEHPRLWLDVGTVKDGLENTQAVRKKLLELGWQEGPTLGYLEVKGADHSEKAWAARAPLALQYLLDPHDRAKPF